MTPSKKDASHDPLAELDDDLGDDWESAFQAEDFMFSPEDEPSDFFLFDENSDSNEDIADLLAAQDTQTAGLAADTTSVAAPAAEAESAAVLEFPGRLQILAASLLQVFLARPPYQRWLIGAIPLLPVLIIISTLFFQSTTDELASLDDQAIISDTAQVAPTTEDQDVDSSTVQPQQPMAEPSVPLAEKETVLHTWKFPTFIIVAKGENKANLIVSIDLTLLAKLEEGQSLPDDKKIFVKDIIHQFYTNRPAYELKRFALARGDMISQLNTWITKQWPENPFDTVAFSRYSVTQTPPSITPGPLAPKITFM